MHLQRIEIRGFKSIHQVRVNLTSLNILIGQNGSGKSNFITLFKLLNQMVEQNFQIYVQRQGGADAFLHYGRKNTDSISISLKFGRKAYRCVWIPTVDDRLIFADEVCISPGEHVSESETPLGTGHQESKLFEAVAKRGKDSPPSYVLKIMQSWKVYHFHDTSNSAPIKRIGNINDNLYLRSNAGNLAAYLYRLQKTATSHYEAIRETIRMVVPFFDDFVLRPLPENEGKIRLEWRERGSDYPFLAHQISDGTLRFICLATLLLQPNLPSTILIDEPELGMHPYAISVLGSLIRSAAAKTQLIVSTQSVSLVNQFNPGDLLIVERKQGTTTIERVDANRLSIWLEEYTLGDLWEKNIFGGRPVW